MGREPFLFSFPPGRASPMAGERDDRRLETAGGQGVADGRLGDRGPIVGF